MNMPAQFRSKSRSRSIATRDTNFYWDNVIFQVEDKLYKIPRHPLEKESESIFASMFSLPQSGDVEGLTDDRPIVLEGTSKVEWELLLSVIFPSTSTPHPNPPRKSQEDWLSILQLCNKWGLKNIREIAIHEVAQGIPSIASTDLILLGREYDVPKWVFDGYKSLATRPHGLTLTEARKLGLDATHYIGRLREHIMVLIGETNHSVLHGRNASGSGPIQTFGDFRQQAVAYPGTVQMIDEFLKEKFGFVEEDIDVQYATPPTATFPSLPSSPGLLCKP